MKRGLLYSLVGMIFIINIVTYDHCNNNYFNGNTANDYRSTNFNNSVLITVLIAQ